MDEYRCYACGHEMELVEHKIDVRNNGRAYITAFYKCMFEDCPIQKSFGNGLEVHQTLMGIKSDSRFEFEDNRDAT